MTSSDERQLAAPPAPQARQPAVPPVPPARTPDRISADGQGPVPARTLRSRAFVLFFVARAASKLGETMLPVALSAGLLQYGMGASEVGLAMASTIATCAVFIIFGGCSRTGSTPFA